MDINTAINILEMLAAGCSPATGEVISDESILNQRDVIRALQIAIDNLKGVAPTPVSETNNSKVEIVEEDIKAAIQLFTDHNMPPTANRLTGLFLASRKFKDAALIFNKLYGKYKKLYTEGQLHDFFSEYLSKKEYLNRSGKATKKNRDEPWDDIDFFENETFNNLSKADIDKLKEQINDLGITKTENLSPNLILARKQHLRAYEPWSETEKQLLAEALNHTNDVKILTQCFQRGPGAIRSCGKKLIFERETA